MDLMKTKKDNCEMETDVVKEHRPPMEEIAFYKAVASGDMDAIEKNINSKRFVQTDGVGVLSKNPVQNLKYHFVVTAALITRMCIENGLVDEEAFQLSDYYIRKMDVLGNIDTIEKLHDEMVIDFTKRMMLKKGSLKTSKSISEAINYIYVHRNEYFNVGDVANAVGISQSYLSRQFRKEVGVTISSYIREKKMEIAMNMLKYSDCSEIEISNKLNFSSQSHFIQVFRQHVGITPRQYREKNSNKKWCY